MRQFYCTMGGAGASSKMCTTVYILAIDSEPVQEGLSGRNKKGKSGVYTENMRARVSSAGLPSTSLGTGRTSLTDWAEGMERMSKCVDD
jgi:hypothetical protein